MAFKWFGKNKGGDSVDTDENRLQNDTSETTSEQHVPETDSDQDNDAGTGDSGKTSVFSRLKSGLSKTRDFLNTDIEDLFRSGKKLDGDLLEELEEILITSDIGVATTMELVERISGRISKNGISGPKDLIKVLRNEILELIRPVKTQQIPVQAKPHVIMVVGVNGVGKTTTIGKIAAKYSDEGKKVLIAASDTFRAAAVEQLSIWVEKAGAELVRHRDNADPAAVAFDAVSAGIARKKDYVIVDTAGRLHTKVNLMEELKKIQRAIRKTIPDAPHEVLLVLDATTGQNALSQAKMFHDAIGVTSMALTKLDGTAKGGIVVSIVHSMDIPLKYIGVGEGISDLQEFDAERFVSALF